MNSIEAMIPYIKHLLDYPDFDSQTTTLACQSGPDSPFRFLNSKFDLKSKLKGNTDLERIAAMMQHVHRELLCCKEMVQPKSLDFESIMAIKQTGSVFCSCYAVCLTEAFLAVGIPAVQVTCLPFEFDGDRHVGVLAHISDLDRTAFFDPTFCTYFYNEHAPLDLFAVRDAYRSGQPPQFVPIPIDKQWSLYMNGKEYADYDAWYRDYMAKNCFRFSLSDAYVARRRLMINPIGYSRTNQYDTAFEDRLYLQTSAVRLVSDQPNHNKSL